MQSIRPIRSWRWTNFAKSLAILSFAISVVTDCDRSPNQPKGTTTRSAPASQAQPTASISLATSKNVWCTLALVADQNGYFRDQALNVELKYQAAGRYCLDAVISGSADVATIVEVNVAFHAFTGNKNLSVVGTIARSRSSAIVARRSAGIASPADLKGKRVALSPGTTSDVFAYRFLEKHGLQASDVDLRPIQPAALQGAMESRGVDAASTWEPFAENIAAALGADAIVFREPDAYMGYENVAVRRDWAAQHGREIVAFLQALRNAEGFVKAHPAEAQRLVSQAINMSPDMVKSVWTNFDLRLVLDVDSFVQDVTDEGKWIVRVKSEFRNKSLPDYHSYLDQSYLSQIDK